MKEIEYILVHDLAMLRSAVTSLRDITPANNPILNRDLFKQARDDLASLLVELTGAISIGDDDESNN